MFEQLRECVRLGIVTVAGVRGGYEVRGAENDMHLRAELEQAGAEWDEGRGAYFLASASAEARGIAREVKSLKKATKAAALALAARREIAARNGSRVFDLERRKYQKELTREIREVYRQAMLEHMQSIKSIASILGKGKPEGVDAGEWARTVAMRKNTKKELESVVDALAAGLAKAGQNALAVTNASLPESAATARRIASWQVSNMAGIDVSRLIGHNYAALAATGATSYHGKFDLKAWQGVADREQCRNAIKRAVTRGLLTGEHPERIAQRFEGIFEGTEPLSPHARAVRIARTETNRVMNEATLERIGEANAKGIKTLKRWDAKLDERVRDSHARVHGEVRADGEKFSNGCLKPGDGGPAESINCRCSLEPVLEGFDPVVVPLLRNPGTGEFARMEKMTFSEWEARDKARFGMRG